MITNPKTFFEQFQNFIEESGLQLKKFKSNLSNYFTKSEAIDTFLGKTDQAESAKKSDEAIKATQDASGNVITATYATKAELSNKLDASSAFTKAQADNLYLGKSAKATSASVADTANSATKATQDAKGNVIDITYLTKNGKAESAKSADAATKAIQDGDGNVISGTYLKSTTAQSTYLSKSDASSTYLTKSDAKTTYLGKTAKAESAKVADSATTAVSATKATQDGSGNNIEQTYAKKTDIPTVPEVDTSKFVVKNGNRGVLSGSESTSTIGGSGLLTIDKNTPDTSSFIGKAYIKVLDGEKDDTWTKVALINNLSTVVFEKGWSMARNSDRYLRTQYGLLVLHWCDGVGIASITQGTNTYTRPAPGTITYTDKTSDGSAPNLYVVRNNKDVYVIPPGSVKYPFVLYQGDILTCKTEGRLVNKEPDTLVWFEELEEWSHETTSVFDGFFSEFHWYG